MFIYIFISSLQADFNAAVVDAQFMGAAAVGTLVIAWPEITAAQLAQLMGGSVTGGRSSFHVLMIENVLLAELPLAGVREVQASRPPCHWTAPVPAPRCCSN